MYEAVVIISAIAGMVVWEKLRLREYRRGYLNALRHADFEIRISRNADLESVLTVLKRLEEEEKRA